MKRAGQIAGWALLVVFGFCFPTVALLGQPDAKQSKPVPIRRLILTDGSYERISRYSIEGDRVRYFSVERSVWEELPSPLVDWDATEKYARDYDDVSSGRLNAEIGSEAQEKQEEEARFPRVAPGLRIPTPDGVYLLDAYEGRSVLVALPQSEADVNKNTRSNILRGVLNPVSSARQTVELAGPRARIQSHIPQPAIYIPVAPDSQAGFATAPASSRFRLVQCEDKKGNRVVSVYRIAIYGKVSQESRDVEIRVEPVSEYWMKIVPSAPLSPGEYALVEVDEKGAMNLFVRDFGVDAKAPPNPGAEVETPERKQPELLQKPQKEAVP